MFVDNDVLFEVEVGWVTNLKASGNKSTDRVSKWGGGGVVN